MVAEILDALADGFAGCETVAYADLSTSMVLVTNSGAEQSREELNALCTEAEVTLGQEDAAPVGPGTCYKAVSFSGGMTRVFLRSAKVPDDILCCICQPGIDVAAFLDAAEACLNELVGDG